MSRSQSERGGRKRGVSE